MKIIAVATFLLLQMFTFPCQSQSFQEWHAAAFPPLNKEAVRFTYKAHDILYNLKGNIKAVIVYPDIEGKNSHTGTLYYVSLQKNAASFAYERISCVNDSCYYYDDSLKKQTIFSLSNLRQIERFIKAHPAETVYFTNPNTRFLDSCRGIKDGRPKADFCYDYEDQGSLLAVKEHDCGSAKISQIFKIKKRPNRIIEIDYAGNGEVDSFKTGIKTLFTYDSLGRVMAENMEQNPFPGSSYNSFKKINYDTAGNYLGSVLKQLTKTSLAISTITTYETYQYNAFDARGNWTERTVSKWSEEEVQVLQPTPTTRSEIRQIFYW